MTMEKKWDREKKVVTSSLNKMANPQSLSIKVRTFRKIKTLFLISLAMQNSQEFSFVA